jgi:hypothetical protein
MRFVKFQEAFKNDKTMKRIKYFMGMLVVAGMFSVTPATAQTHSVTQKEKRHLEQMRRKKAKSEKRKVSHDYYLQLLQKKYFVFQADYLTDTQGNSFILSPDVNFMSVSGDNVVLQFGFDDVIGWNGVGGITVRGTLFNYRLDQGKKNKGLNVRSDMHIIGPGLPPHINLWVSDDGTAQLTILTGTGDQVTLFGRIMAPEKAYIYKGVPLF